jgi:hypothetical protein
MYMSKSTQSSSQSVAASPLDILNPDKWSSPCLYVWIKGIKKERSIKDERKNAYTEKLESIGNFLARPIINSLFVASERKASDPSSYIPTTPKGNHEYDPDNFFADFKIEPLFMNPALTLPEARNWVYTSDADNFKQDAAWTIFVYQEFEVPKGEQGGPNGKDVRKEKPGRRSFVSGI